MEQVLNDKQYRTNLIINYLISKKNELFIGTPCAIISSLFFELERKKSNLVYAPREDLAVAVACGFSMRGKKAVVLMQNSGFAQSLNVLASLVEPFNIPIMMLITLRGYQIDNTRENSIMGKITCSLLNDIGIAYKILKSNTIIADLDWANNYLEQEKKAVALLITPEFLEWRP